MGIASEALKNFEGFNLKNLPEVEPISPGREHARAAEKYWLCGKQ